MTDTPTTHAPAAAKYKGLLWHITIHKALLITSWLAPLIIMGFGYAFFPDLRLSVDWPWNAPPSTWTGAFVQLLLVIGWLIYEFWYTSHRNAAVTDLQVDAFVDLVIWGLLFAIMGATLNEGTLKWFYLVPFLGQTIDVLQAVLMGINNAAEKPYLSPKGST